MAKKIPARTFIRRGLTFVVVAFLVVLAGGYVFLERQGAPANAWEKFRGAKVRFDSMGIPTIEAEDWSAVLRAEGYVVASERLWQMDLLRHKAAGRLSEWFGAPALALDTDVFPEDRATLALNGVNAMPPSERESCEQFALGVNKFITEGSGRWSAEYALLRTTPEAWTCADSLLVILEMSEELTASAPAEARNFAWRRHLTPAWQNFLFPDQHPWNVPLFGASNGKPAAFPPEAEWLPKRPLATGEGKPGDSGSPSAGEKTGSVAFEDPPNIGSNNWAWSGPSGIFVANDPHLSYGVPDIWYALRLKVGKEDWVTGVTIPGLPGVVLGMNPHIAWAFTNTGEDVDDYLKETLRNNNTEYLAKGDAATGDWRPVVKKTMQMKVKGEAEPRQIEALFTHRGPLAKRKYLGDDFYSRQWLALKPGVLQLPTISVMRAKSLDEFDHAIDGMRTPSQNIVAADRVGNLLYRTSGTGVDRPLIGTVPQEGVAGEWRGLKDSSSRPRLRVAREPSSSVIPKFIATANQRIWRDEFGNAWSSDDRVDRIRTVLAANPNQTRPDMEALQKDSSSRFRRMLVDWVATNAGPQTDPAFRKVADSWRAFDGSSTKFERIFTHTDLMEDRLSAILLGRVRDAFLTGADREVKYESWMRRAWVLAVLMANGDAGLAPFGLTAREVAVDLLATVVAADAHLTMHSEANRWLGQHPFVGRVPLIGALFSIDEYPQTGAGDTPRAERPRFGPSTRMVWDLSKPSESTWSFPVGQSGHVLNPHYHDFQALWREGKSVPVFPAEIASEFQF